MLTNLKTAAHVRSEFRRQGISLAQWARDNNVSYSLTHEVLGGRCKGHYGQAHKIAVLLGLKAAGKGARRRATNSAKAENAG